MCGRECDEKRSRAVPFVVEIFQKREGEREREREHELITRGTINMASYHRMERYER